MRGLHLDALMPVMPIVRLGIALAVLSSASATAVARPTVDAGPVTLGQPLFSPTRNELALKATFDEHDLCGRDAGPRTSDVFIVNADGSALRRIVPSDPLHAREAPSWSPDGKRLSVLLWTADGRVDRNVQVVTRTGQIEYSEVFAEPAGWAPDSRHLAINHVDPTDSPTDVVIRDLRAGDVWRLGPYGFGDVRWSPRGKLIAYASNGFIYAVRTNRTGRHRVIAAADAFALQWSGDGTLLGYQGSSRRGYGALYVVAPDGRNRRRVATRDTGWSFAPHGRVLAVNRTLIDFATGRRWSVLPRRITGVRFAVWAPNGRALAYVTRIGMYVVDPDGRHGHLIRWPKDQPTSDPSWSHDSRTLAFATAAGLYKVQANGGGRGYVRLSWCDATRG